jgi:hypothetical protein
MNPRANSGKTSTASVYFKFFIFYTILWCIILNWMDILPKVGESMPHRDGWRPATMFDRAKTFVLLTTAFYASGFFTIWVIMKLQRNVCDTMFGGDPGYDEWRRQGGDPFVDVLGAPWNNQSKLERWSTGPATCCRCKNLLNRVVINGVNAKQCLECGMAWDGEQWWYPSS